MPSFFVYSAADIGLSDTFANWFSSPSSIVSASGTPDILQLSDNDLLLEDEGAGSDQLLTADLYIDGGIVGTIGDKIINLGQSTVSNFSTGQTGYLIVIQVNGVAVGYASNIPLNQGDAISSTAWAGTPKSINYSDLTPSCFTKGALILTKAGEIPIEQLSVGDKIWTRDNGYQTIRWAGAQKCIGKGRFAPICIMAGALGNTRELMVSPMHRMLVTGWKLGVLFNKTEIFSRALDLVNGGSIIQREQDQIEYFHLLFDDHQIICAENCPSESFHPFRAEIGGYDADTHSELLSIFPVLNSDDTIWPDARPTLTRGESMLLQTL